MGLGNHYRPSSDDIFVQLGRSDKDSISQSGIPGQVTEKGRGYHRVQIKKGTGGIVPLSLVSLVIL